MSDFYQKLPKPFFALAPMEDVTDIVFRQVIARAGRPDLFYTEFTNTKSLDHKLGQVSALRRLKFLPKEQPLVAQIWGSEPEYFAKASHRLKQMGYQAIDINTGCPDKAVVKSGGGSSLIKNPELTAKIIEATRTSGLPVSVKTRLGFSKVEEWRDWISFLLEQNLPLLTIHLRTRKEMSKVPAHFELIPEILALRDKIAPQTLIAINGDIEDKQHGLELYKQYQFDGVMIGRGVFASPYCFTNKKPSKEELINLLNYHLDLFDQHNQDGKRKYAPLKKFFKIYINNFKGAKDLRIKLMNTKNTAEARGILKNYG